MKRTHLTEACEHEEKTADGKSEWCVHCEEGCQYCGALEGINDDQYCEECALDRAIMAAEYAFEGDR